MAALRTEPERLLELVVPVMGMAARARVRMVGRRSRLVVGLDRNVDVGHGASLDRAPRAQVAAAASKAERGGQPLELLDVGGRGETGQADADDRPALANPGQLPLDLDQRG